MKKTKTMVWDSVAKRLTNIASDNWFFAISTILFALGSIWTAFSSLYPGAFDEDTHLGIIKFFSMHPNPVFGVQPTYLDTFGAVVHDPSYLFRFIMALPWWVVIHLTSSFATQVFIMRLINICLVVCGIYLFRKFLFQITSNKVVINLALLLFMLTPMTTQLAAQINYDNLMLPLIALNLLLAVKVANSIKKLKPDLSSTCLLIALGLTTSLVKYTFLPMFVGVLLYLGWVFIKFYIADRKLAKTKLKTNLSSLSVASKLLLTLAVLLSFGLFFERYGLNIIRYHSPTPQCATVIGTKRCGANSIYNRGVEYANNKPAHINKNPIRFTFLWLKHMEFNIMMVINGPSSGYSTGVPLPLPYIAAISFVILGIILCFVFWRRVWANSAMKIFWLSIAFYLVLLWHRNLSDYLDTGRRVAVQGRYLIVFLPVLYAMFLLVLDYALKNWPKLRTVLASLLVICFMVGGGALTYILHSDASWYWPNNKQALKINSSLQRSLRPIIPGSHYSQFWQTSFEF